MPILLKKETEYALELLTQKRESCSIRPGNPYIFPVSKSDNYLRGNDCMRAATKSCGAKKPTTLQSTNLRKHVATLCQIIDLKENELDILAQYMGHDMHVHRNNRLPDSTLQSALLAKLFLAMEDGTLVGQKGKTLEELTVQMPKDDLGRSAYFSKTVLLTSWALQTFATILEYILRVHIESIILIAS